MTFQTLFPSGRGSGWLADRGKRKKCALLQINYLKQKVLNYYSTLKGDILLVSYSYQSTCIHSSTNTCTPVKNHVMKRKVKFPTFRVLLV